MSRIAKAPIIVPFNVDIEISGQIVTVKGKNGKLTYNLHRTVEIKYENNILTFNPRHGYSNNWSQAGTARAILNTMVVGVTDGFVKKLQLVGVGYRVVIKENVINLSLGFSHLINYQLPFGITAECPSQTEILLKSSNKQMIGQVAADLRSYRRPEPYKGKGIRYSDEILCMKEAKKK